MSESREGPAIPHSELSFAAQFNNTENLKVPGGIATVVDISPERSKTDVPVYFAEAWACTLPVYEPTLKVLTGSGRRVISSDHPRVGVGFKNQLDPEISKQFPTEGVRRALNILKVLEEKGIEKTDAIGHSEGGMDLAIAATIRPDLFRNIVLFAPAGLIGEDTVMRLAKGFGAQSQESESLSAKPYTIHYDDPTTPDETKMRPEIPITETTKQVAKTSQREGAKYVAHNPLRAVREAVGMASSKSQIHEILRALHEKGVGIVVMSGVDDSVFPMDQMQEIVKADMLDGFLSVRGGHGAIGDHPELFMGAAENMLSQLEEKKAANPPQKKTDEGTEE